jgi:hypothetical protein
MYFVFQGQGSFRETFHAENQGAASFSDSTATKRHQRNRTYKQSTLNGQFLLSSFVYASVLNNYFCGHVRISWMKHCSSAWRVLMVFPQL